MAFYIIKRKIDEHFSKSSIIDYKNDSVINEYYSITDNDLFLIDFFGDSFKRVNGVYLIGDFYIGQSTNIKNRLLSHCRNALRSPSTKMEFYLRNKILSNSFIGCKILSKNIRDEQQLIFDSILNGMNLLNNCNTSKNAKLQML